MQSVFTPGPASPVVRGSDGAVYAVSSFGVDGTSFGPDWRPHDVLQSLRRRALTFRRSFARCTQHDWKMFDSQGRFIHSGPIEYWQPLIGSSQPAYYVPLDQRRPSAPVRLAKLITTRFTTLVFGDDFPKVRCPGDSEAEDFANALIERQALHSVFVRARNMGGSTGTVGLSWRFCEGEPRTRVHDPAALHVHAWADKERCKVDHVTELQIVEREVWNQNTKKVEKKAHWLRRDWTPNADLVFCEVMVTAQVPEWVLDVDESFIHNEGRAHFVWIQNIPPDEDGWSPDGIADYEGCEEPMLTLDTLSSVLNTGTVRNLDPTLKLKMDPEIIKHAGTVMKGSDNALITGIEGDASYLELSGTSAQIGMSLRKEERQHVLDTANCVVPNPDEIAAAGTSGAAIWLLYRPMIGQANLLRTSYGAGLVELLDQQLQSARRHYPVKDPATGEVSYPVEIDDAGEEVFVEGFLQIPPREAEEEVLDEQGQPTGKMSKVLVERHPGTCRDLMLEWPAYFPLTAQEQQATGQALTVATSGKPVLSQRSGVEAFATVLGRDAGKEWERLQEEQRVAREAERGMFLGIGGEVSTEKELPQGAEPQQDAGSQEAKPEDMRQTETATGIPLQVSTEQVLNGAQIAQGVEIVKAVVKGEMPRDAGMGQLRVFFNLTEAQASMLMGSAGLNLPQQEPQQINS